MGLLYGFSHLFPFHELFFHLSHLKGIIYSPKFCKKNIGHHAGLRARDKRASSPGPFIEKQYHNLGIPPDDMTLLHRMGCAVPEESP